MNNILLTRSNFYSFLSRLFLFELDLETLKELRENKNIFELFPNLQTWDSWHNLSDNELLNSHINPDFTNISILHLVPYESFYTREDAMIESGGANLVTNFYHEFGFKVEFNEARVVAPDHIGIELAFMSLLINGENNALINNDIKTAEKILNTQKKFMETHLINWISLYLINFKFEARTPLYYDLGETALAFIFEDYDYINTIIDGKN